MNVAGMVLKNDFAGPDEIALAVAVGKAFASTALTLVSRYSSITDATCHPAEPDLAAHLVPRFPKIAEWACHLHA
jgi:hypothetical protein